MNGVLQVPGAARDITPEWLTTVLRDGGHLPHGVVDAVAVEPIGADRGFTGVVARVRPTYLRGDNAPASMIAKLPTAKRDIPSAVRPVDLPDDEAAQRHFQRCATEVSFYREIANGDPGLAGVYYAATDPDRLRIVLLLEDLVDGVDGDELAGCTPDQARALLEAVAPLHARMWQQKAPTWAVPFAPDPMASQRRYASRVEPFLARYGDALPREVRGLLRRLQSNYAAVLAELNRTPHTLVHGDLHLDNVVFFDGVRAGRPVAVLDWQGVRCAPATVDVGSILFGSLMPEDRRACEADLLEHYAALLRQRGVEDYPLHRLRQDCRLALLCQVAGKVGWLATADPAGLSSREQDLLEAAFGDGRLISALQDHKLA